MQMKYIAAAALSLFASASAFADLTAPQTKPSGGDMFLVVWEQGAPNGGLDQSFTLDLGITTADFQANPASSSVWATLGTGNADWSTFLATSDLSSLQYAVVGAKSTTTSTNAAVASSVFSTVHTGDEGLVAGSTNNIQLSNVISGPIAGYMLNVSSTGTHLTQATGQSVNQVGTDSYFQTGNMQSFNGTLHFGNSNNIGTNSEFTQLYRAATGGNTGIALEAVQAGVVSFNKVGNDYVLSYNVAAVPEASGYVMALAGFGVMGFLGVRRNKKQA